MTLQRTSTLKTSLQEAVREIIRGIRLRSYGVALLSVTLALGLTRLLYPWVNPTLAPLLLLAVMVSAWYGGLKPGLLATVLSTLAINYFFIEPVYSLRIANFETIARLSVFVVAAGSIGSLNQSRHGALRDARVNLQALQEAMSRDQETRNEAQAAKVQRNGAF